MICWGCEAVENIPEAYGERRENCLRELFTMLHGTVKIELIHHPLSKHYGEIVNTDHEPIEAALPLSIFEIIHNNAEDGSDQFHP